MRRKRLLLLQSLILFCTAPWSQDTAKPMRLCVLLSPALVPVPGIVFALQPGLEARLGRWGLAARVAVPLHKPRERFTDIRYLRKSAELKWFFKQQKQRGAYLSAEAQCARRSFTRADSGTYFKGPYDERYRYSSAHIRSPVFSVAVKAGGVFAIGKKLVVDAFAGLGIRSVRTRYSKVQNEAPLPYGLLEISFPKGAYRFDKTFATWHIPCGVKLGYVLW